MKRKIGLGVLLFVLTFLFVGCKKEAPTKRPPVELPPEGSGFVPPAAPLFSLTIQLEKEIYDINNVELEVSYNVVDKERFQSFSEASNIIFDLQIGNIDEEGNRNISILHTLTYADIPPNSMNSQVLKIPQNYFSNDNGDYFSIEIVLKRYFEGMVYRGDSASDNLYYQLLENNQVKLSKSKIS